MVDINGDKHFKSKLKNADVLKWRREYTKAGKPIGWLKDKWRELDIDISYCVFCSAIRGRLGRKKVWQI